MSDQEKVAQYVETLHCDRWKDDELDCRKSNCENYRYVAYMIRNMAVDELEESTK